MVLLLALAIFVFLAWATWAVSAACYRSTFTESADLTALTAKLRAVNEALWQIEDDIRACERQQDFGPRFVDLARSVYRTNDERAALKRHINELLGAALVEQKHYVPYT